ncbi:MAG: type IX secretion system outer membrane channel protein PorV [Ignavibacteria bacterium]|nr:type IX secretion system outer membrane channel protein PorV [Ignavibacteria bacterium]
MSNSRCSNGFKLFTVLILSFLIFTSAEVFAQKTISTGVPFLLIGPNSRFSAMGETGTAIADDATAMHWNPAGLAFQTEHTEINFTHSPWLAGLNISDLFYDYLAAKRHIESINGTLGLSLTYLNIGTIIHTDEFGNRLGEYKAYEFALAVGYATKVTTDLGLGVNARFIFSNLSSVSVGNEKGSGTAFSTSFDLAALYRFSKGPGIIKDKLSLGLNLSNLGPKISYVDADQADPIPTNLRLGIAYKIFKNEGNELTFAADFSKLLVNRPDAFYEALFTSWKGGPSEIGKSIQSSVGAEYWYGNPKLIALRAGYFYEDPDYGNRKYITLGAGIRYSLYGFDFSYISTIEDTHPLANTLRFGFVINF